MKTRFKLLRQGFFSDSFDPLGSYTGNYYVDNGEEYDEEPEQDADDL